MGWTKNNPKCSLFLFTIVLYVWDDLLGIGVAAAAAAAAAVWVSRSMRVVILGRGQMFDSRRSVDS
jgi:hypothetical protein